jgi:DNA-binding PucR family transcriptional regulator
MAKMPKKVTAQTVRYMTRAGMGKNHTEPVAETWAQRQERVNAERAARRAQREAEAREEG